MRLPDWLITGSSIMPNKRNPDVVELLRASVATVAGALAEVGQVLSLPSGYHRDVQLTKGPTIRAMLAAEHAAALVADVVGALSFDERRMAAAIDPELHATDRAVDLAPACRFDRRIEEWPRSCTPARFAPPLRASPNASRRALRRSTAAGTAGLAAGGDAHNIRFLSRTARPAQPQQKIVRSAD